MFHFENDPPEGEEKVEIPGELPSSYNQDILVLMIRDPHTAFLYWDLKKVEGNVPEDTEPSGQYQIRIYKESTREMSSTEPILHREIPIIKGVRSCYFELDENYDRYHAILEYIPFFEEPLMITHSNVILPPKGSMAGESDREWKSIEKVYRKFYSLVKKELQTDPMLEEVLAEEDIEELELADLEELDKMEEPGEMEDWEEMEEEEEGEDIDGSEEEIEPGEARREKPERKTRKTKTRKAARDARAGKPVKETRTEALQKERIKRRQEALRRIITVYIERRGLPGGMYAPAIPPPEESKDNRKKD